MTKPELYAIAGGVALLAFVMSRGAQNAGAIGESLGGAAVNLVDGVLTGAVVSTGEIFGIPKTEKSRGDTAWDNGEYFEASLYLPAPDFIGKVWGSIVN